MLELSAATFYQCSNSRPPSRRISTTAALVARDPRRRLPRPASWRRPLNRASAQDAFFRVDLTTVFPVTALQKGLSAAFQIKLTVRRNINFVNLLRRKNLI
jgi:hypothetical protein